MGMGAGFAVERDRLVKRLKSEIKDERVLTAMGRIPRECFVPAYTENVAYDDSPLPIGFQQTISQPQIVAMMTEALELTGSEKVLEVGTGSGYQAAILAELCHEVITTERIPPLVKSAKSILDCLGYSNIKIHLTENNLGWEAEGPYAGIIVTAGAPQVPHELLNQLEFGGRLVIPIGTRHMQELYQITKLKDRNIYRSLGGCRFVPLIGKNAWNQ